ncbi:methyltransferase domain-containing protein [Streptomyces sp. NPDC020141]|uniref:methyltransferase domain-containing protein n=1 Tax=Streptomyces sp. NPDC020141 TaxID=3365065 RepID=UPI0037946103
MDSLTARRARLDAVMEARGDWPERSPWIREAVGRLPRDLFAPDRLWRWDGEAYAPVDRAADPGAWADELYADPDAAAVTQVTDGFATSSLSCQAVVVDMLDSLRPEPGHRVLELGAGTGWNAALVSLRTGADTVTSVEVDASLAAAARARLADRAPGVRVLVGDGAHGLPGHAPYDRVVAAYAVDRVPWAWVAQTAPGGRIVTPWGRLGHVALTVADDGRSASGWIQGLAQFMPARAAGATTGQTDQTGQTGFGAVRAGVPRESERPWTRDLAPLRDDWDLVFALRVALPELRFTVDADGLGARVHDGVSSWAVLAAPDGRSAVAQQGGPRRLADELDRAWAAWTETGSPSRFDHGLTVTPDRQYAWAVDAETGPRWTLG